MLTPSADDKKRQEGSLCPNTKADLSANGKFHLKEGWATHDIQEPYEAQGHSTENLWYQNLAADYMCIKPTTMHICKTNHTYFSLYKWTKNSNSSLSSAIILATNNTNITKSSSVQKACP